MGHGLLQWWSPWWPSGRNLKRIRLIKVMVMTTVVPWRPGKKHGWLCVEEPLDHFTAAWHGGRVYVHRKDLCGAGLQLTAKWPATFTRIEIPSTRPASPRLGSAVDWKEAQDPRSPGRFSEASTEASLQESIPSTMLNARFGRIAGSQDGRILLTCHMGRQDFAFLVSWSPNLLLNFLSEILGHCHSPHSIVRDAALWTLNQLLGAAETTKLMNPRVDFEAAVSIVLCFCRPQPTAVNPTIEECDLLSGSCNAWVVRRSIFLPLGKRLARQSEWAAASNWMREGHVGKRKGGASDLGHCVFHAQAKTASARLPAFSAKSGVVRLKPTLGLMLQSAASWQIAFSGCLVQENDYAPPLLIIGCVLAAVAVLLLGVLLFKNLDTRGKHEDHEVHGRRIGVSSESPRAQPKYAPAIPVYGQQKPIRSAPAGTPSRAESPPSVKDSAARRAFNSIDKDRSGFITRQELNPYLANMPPETAEAVFQSLDRDGDNRISFEEFERYFYPIIAHEPQPVDTPENAVLGICSYYLLNVFPELAQVCTGLQNPNFYDMAKVLAAGPTGTRLSVRCSWQEQFLDTDMQHGLGHGKVCPRDGKRGCSIVDAVDARHRGKVTHFLSWCWAYKLQDFVSAISSWTKRHELVTSEVFLWICFFCNNQYRILESATDTGPDELKEAFESNLAKAGRMLILLDSFERAWCIFETYVCIDNKFPMTIILPEHAEDLFRQKMETAGGLRNLRQEFGAIDARSAKASSQADQQMIRDLILRTTGYNVVNEAVKKCLLDQLKYLFEACISRLVECAMYVPCMQSQAQRMCLSGWQFRELGTEGDAQHMASRGQAQARIRTIRAGQRAMT
ncbi:PVALEF [Symbiodinium microadriaticum]|nr:PVALEF [Symbiodinium microadriaticum]